VQRRDAQIESRQNLFGVVHAALVADVELDRFQQHRSAIAERVKLVDARPLRLEFSQVETAHHAQVVGVVAHREVLVTELRGACAVLLQCGATVGCVGMRVQVTTDVGERNEVRHAALERELDLSGILPYLGRHHRQTERPVHVVLLPGGQVNSVRAARHAVGVQREAARLGDLAQPHVVFRRAGVVLQRRTPTPGADHAHLDLLPRGGHDDGRGLCLGEHRRHQRVRPQGDHHACGLLGSDEDLDVAHRLFHPANAAGARGVAHAGQRPERDRQLLGERECVGEQHARADSAIPLDACRDVAERLVAKAGKAVETPLGQSLFEVVDRGDAELVVEELRRLRSQPGNADELDHRGGNARRDLL